MSNKACPALYRACNMKIGRLLGHFVNTSKLMPSFSGASFFLCPLVGREAIKISFYGRYERKGNVFKLHLYIWHQSEIAEFLGQQFGGFLTSHIVLQRVPAAMEASVEQRRLPPDRGGREEPPHHHQERERPQRKFLYYKCLFILRDIDIKKTFLWYFPKSVLQNFEREIDIDR